MLDLPIVLFDDASECCGCGACSCICPQQAISMRADESGFVFPVIDEDKCVQCGLCTETCAFQTQAIPNELQEVYVASSAITDIRRSASGGIFAALAEQTLAAGGIVAGAALDFEGGIAIPRLVCIDDTATLDRILCSKYVQCDQNIDIYARVLDYLKQGRAVTFGGTPCQVAALRSFAYGYDERLLLVDVVCHGVPNSRFFNDYLKMRAHELGATVINYSFRDKRFGWSFIGRIDYVKDGKAQSAPINGLEESYYRLFLEAQTYRESCYQCPYASPLRSGDLSIGDFWGIREQHPELFDGTETVFDDDLGVSSLIVNTQKGKRYLEEHAGDFNLQRSTYEKASANNKQLLRPVERTHQREEILNAYLHGGYESVSQWFADTYKKAL
ncbi:MAG: coenzyme F420 hydrogenase [Eggerthellaceae bacterium]|nr:coenzyme F420 hydrogenase [Eggerthellaceae bacterium]